MRIYLTSSWTNRERMEWMRGWLEKQGHVVVSTWFDRTYPADVPQDWWAPIDLGEIDSADAVLLYTPDAGDCMGAMDFEAGYAFATHKNLYIIGPDARNIFLARYARRWPISLPRDKMAA